MSIEDEKVVQSNKILVVDDEPDIVFFLKHLLEENSYEIHTAFNALEAIDILNRIPIDVLISDIRMPGIDGIELINRAVKRQPDIQSIVLTGDGDIDTVVAALRAGAISYLKKPLNFPELLVFVEKGLEKRRLHLEIKTKQQNIETANRQLEDKVALRTVELEKNNIELRKALDNIKTLKTLLPICASCKKIRDDKGYWSQIETYISRHVDTDFSHGICPDCVKKLHPEIYDSMKEMSDCMKKTEMIKILIVDDEADNLNIVGEYIGVLGFDFSVAANGVEALELLRKGAYDVVLTDMQMPKMDGMTLLGNIQKEFPGIDVIVMTGYCDTCTSTDAIRAGANDYMAKPFTCEELRAKLQRLLSERNLVRNLNHEILKRNLLELELRKHNGMFKGVLEAVNYPLYVVNIQDYTIKFANKACGFGDIGPQSTCYKLIYHRDTPCEGADFPCPCDIITRTKEAAIVKRLNSDRNGNELEVELHGFPIIDQDGEVRQIVECIIDISKRKTVSDSNYSLENAPDKEDNFPANPAKLEKII